VLVTGGAGLVGRHLAVAAPAGVEVHVTWRTAAPPAGVHAHRVELTRADDVGSLLAEVAPDVVIHTAYSMHDRDDVVTATAEVAAACAATGAALVHLSTDVVFDGTRAPYVEHDPVAPVNDYGRRKVEAEQLARGLVPDVCITRTSLVVALDPPDAGTRRLLDAVTAGDRPTLFRDEVRCPIRAADLAASIWALVAMDRADRAGTWHLPGPEALTRLELGRRLLAAAGLDPDAPLDVSARDHPEPRPPDLTLHSMRPRPGPPPRPVDLLG
jgi:dTDP-4-dehydrorhamnose reductase